jgi:hypothetical protein
MAKIKKMKDGANLYLDEKLHDNIFDYIDSHRALSARELKKEIFHHFENKGYDTRTSELHSTLKYILVDLLIGDRRLKLPYIRNILHNFRTIDQLVDMVSRQYGRGTIGSKALGMESAHAILNNAGIRKKYNITLPVYKPESYYLSSKLLLDFFNSNRHLGKYRRLKQKSFEYIIQVQNEIENDFENAKMPGSIENYLHKILREIHRPIIVRSSSKLEDNVEASFAGKYDSYFLSNEGSEHDRLEALVSAIKKIWRSLFSADAIIYRLKMGFLHRDEQMGILLQKVIGRKFDIEYDDPKTNHKIVYRLFAPVVAGVGFSRNLVYIFSKKMKQEDGLVRLVIGLGTRAVDRKFAHEASLSLPGFYPERNPYLRQKMSQSIMDCLDLSGHKIDSLEIGWLATHSTKFYDILFPFISIVKDGYLTRPTNHFELDFQGEPGKRITDNILVDFHNLLQIRRGLKGYSFPDEFRNIFSALEEHFGHPVDLEFALNTDSKGNPKFYILQCRALHEFEHVQRVIIPNFNKNDLLIEDRECLSHGFTGKSSEYIIYVDSLAYKNFRDKLSVARAIGKIVHHPIISDKGIVAIFPGRTGSNNEELGVPVHFSEISEINGLVEYGDEVLTTDISYGTHFYTGMIDVNIGFMPVQKNVNTTYFNEEFFRTMPTMTKKLVNDEKIEKVIRVIHITGIFKNKKAFLYLNGVEKRGVLILSKDSF